MSYTDPSFIHPDRPTSGVTTKTINQMTLSELKAKADADAIRYYREQWQADPENPQKRAEYENYCHQVGIAPNPEINRLKSLSRAQLANEWAREGQKIEAQNQDEWRAANAKTFIASHPAYTTTPENAAKIVAEMDSRGLRGSVADLETVFDYLVKQGDIQPKPQPAPPVKLLTEDEMRNMPLDQLRNYIEDAGRKGIL